MSMLDPVLFCIGAVSVLGQVVLFRELMVAGYGAELICVLSLGVWMLLNAIGVFMAASERGPHLSASLFLSGVGFAAGMIFIRSIRILFGMPPGTYLPLNVFIPSVIVVLLPICLFLGAAFQRAADQGLRHGHTLARAYAVECAGSVFGGMLSAVLLYFGIQNLAQALICTVMAMTAAALAVEHVSGKGRILNNPLLKWTPAGISLIILITATDRLDYTLTRWNHPDLIESLDTEYGRLSVTRSQGQTVLYQNDVLIADSQSSSAEELVHLACLEHAYPRQMLILEGFSEGLAVEAARHRPDRIDQVEIDPTLIQLTRKYMTADFPEVGPYIDVRTHIADPRQYLRSGQAFDVIISGCAEPSTALSNRFFTQTFFRWCRKRLMPDGILAFRLISSENFWSPTLSYRNASVIAALSSVFPHVLVLPGSVNVVLASASELVIDPRILIMRFQNRSLDTRLVTPPYIDYVLSNDRREEIDRMLASQSAFPNTDDLPVCYSLTSWIWLSRLIPDLAHQTVSDWLQAAFRYGWIAMGFIVLATGIGMNRLAAGGRRLAYTASCFAGFSAMVLESAMMLHYQTQSGALYQNMGILFMAFMLGMSVGAAAMLNLIKRFRDRFVSRFVDAVLFILPAVVCLGWAEMSFLSDAPGLVPVAVLLAAAGFGVSAIFTRYAHESGHPRSLYAADVAGGGIGALVCGILLIPLLGLNRTVFLVGGMSIAAGIGVTLSGCLKRPPLSR
jgi:spermidine synthase